MSNVDGPLKQFVRERSNDAFRTLIERHGAMVSATCRRVLGDQAEVEDAAQAVFLILAKKAGAVADEQSLGPWLHRVAVRVACEMKRKKQVRGLHERRASGERGEAVSLGVSAEEVARVRAALDEAIDALPDKLRLPVVLCLVDQKPVAEAARELGLTDGQVRGRLDRAREKLRDALTGRGIQVSYTVMPLLLTEALSGEPLLAAGVVKKLLAAGAYVAQGATGLGAGVSKNVLGIAEAVTAQMVKAKFVKGLLILGLVGTMAAGGTLGVAWGVDSKGAQVVVVGTPSTGATQAPVTTASAVAVGGQMAVTPNAGTGAGAAAQAGGAGPVGGRTLRGAGVEVLHYKPVAFEEGPETASTQTLPRGWVRRPAFLAGAKIYSMEPGGGADSGYEQGVTVFRATSDGVVMIACAYGYQGNKLGGWTNDVRSSAQLMKEGWKPVGMAVSRIGREFTIFAKMMKAGESQRIRCNKYEPPYVIVKDVVEMPREMKSEFPSAGPVSLVFGDLPVSSGQTSQWTVGQVWGLQPIPVMQKPVVGQMWPSWTEVPDELKTCQIFSKETGEPGVHHGGAADFVVQKDGVVFLAGQLDQREGNLEGDWDERRLTVKNFEEAGWAFVGSMRDNKGLAYAIFRKTVLAGEQYRVRTNKYTPTYVMVKP